MAYNSKRSPVTRHLLLSNCDQHVKMWLFAGFKKYVEGASEPLYFFENLRWFWIRSHNIFEFVKSWILAYQLQFDNKN